MIASFGMETENNYVQSLAAWLYHMTDSGGCKFAVGFDDNMNPPGWCLMQSCCRGEFGDSLNKGRDSLEI